MSPAFFSDVFHMLIIKLTGIIVEILFLNLLLEDRIMGHQKFYTCYQYRKDSLKIEKITCLEVLMDKIWYWLQKTIHGNKFCRGCCMICKYYAECASEEEEK